MTSQTRGPWHRLLFRAGLARPTDGSPRPGGAKRSRYGVYTSARVDQDIDELRARLDKLERRVG